MMLRGKHFLAKKRHDGGNGSLLKTDMFIEAFVRFVLQKYHYFPDVSELHKIGLPKRFTVSFLYLIRTFKLCRKQPFIGVVQSIRYF